MKNIKYSLNFNKYKAVFLLNIPLPSRFYIGSVQIK